LLGQTPTGTVSGSIRDSSGARITGATVRITNVRTQDTQTTASTDTGDYVFPSVRVSEYALEAQASGFKLERRTGVELDVNQNARVDFALAVGQVNEVVEVTSDGTQVDTCSVQLGGTVDAHRVQDLPLNGRNVYDLTALMPGVVNVTTSLVGNNDTNYMNVNGQNVRMDNFYLDGAFNNVLFRNGGSPAPNPDAVEEFHLITSNFDAEFGRLPGSVMNVVTRSGGNAFQGSLFDFLRNNDVNARNFFQAGITPLKWNEFGLAVGGPIRKNRAFFFASYQGLRLRTRSFVTGALPPTVAQRGGDFSSLASSKWPKDPTNGQVFPGGIIPASRLDPVAQNILKMMVPLANNPDGTYSALSAAPSNDDQGMLKIDHQLTASNRLSGTRFLDRSDTKQPFAPNNQSNSPNWGNLDRG
jgi:hypothetical protein